MLLPSESLRSKIAQNGHLQKQKLKALSIGYMSIYIGKCSSNFIPKMGGLSDVNYTSVRLFFKKLKGRQTSLVTRWMRIRLPMQGTWVCSLSRKIPHTIEQPLESSSRFLQLEKDVQAMTKTPAQPKEKR